MGRTVEVRLTADMLEGSNTTVFTFARLPGTRPADLPPQFRCAPHGARRISKTAIFTPKPIATAAPNFISAQNCHPLTDRSALSSRPRRTGNCASSAASASIIPSRNGAQDIPHPVEQSRGQVACRRRLQPRLVRPAVGPGQDACTLVLSAEHTAAGFAVDRARFDPPRRKTTMAFAAPACRKQTPSGGDWRMAARAFVARRGAGRTIIAGYPWFLDWGRDSFISARGLLAAGMVSEVAECWSLSGGSPKTAPCPIPSTATTPPIATLRTRRCGMASFARKRRSTWAEKSMKHRWTRPGRNIGGRSARNRRGLRARHAQRHPHGPGFGLDLESGAFHLDGHQLSRPARRAKGYPVEIQVLWIRLLRQVHNAWAETRRRTVGRPGGPRGGIAAENFLARRARVISPICSSPTPARPPPTPWSDQALRSNYLLAIAFGLFTGAQARRAVDGGVAVFVRARRAAHPGSAARPAAAGDLQRPTAVCWTIRASRIGAVTKETRTPGANRPITTAPPGPGLCRWRAKRWPGPGTVAVRRGRGPGLSGRHG